MSFLHFTTIDTLFITVLYIHLGLKKKIFEMMFPIFFSLFSYKMNVH